MSYLSDPLDKWVIRAFWRRWMSFTKSYKSALLCSFWEVVLKTEQDALDFAGLSLAEFR